MYKEIITLGLSVISGFILAMIFAGRATGEKGVLPSIKIKFKNKYIHLHHWIWGTVLLVSLLISLCVKPDILEKSSLFIIAGLLGGLIFQGVLMYNDWYIIIKQNK